MGRVSGAWLAALLAVGCGSSAVQQATSEADPAVGPVSERVEPTEPVVEALRPTRTAAAPANDAAAARLHPGFRLPAAVVHGDVTELAYAAYRVASLGFVPNASLGPVFVPVPPPVREGATSLLRSSAELRDRPSGRVIARFVSEAENEHYDHRVTLLGEERNGQRLVAYWGTSHADEHFEVLAWARTRDLTMQPMGTHGRGFGSGTGFGSGRSLRIAIRAGTALFDEEGGAVIGVAYEDSVVVADAAPAGGFNFDIFSPGGVLSLYTARGAVVASEAPPLTP